MPSISFAVLHTSNWDAKYVRDPAPHETRRTIIKFQGNQGTYQVTDLATNASWEGSMNDVTYTQNANTPSLARIHGKWMEADSWEGEFTFEVSLTGGTFDGAYHQTSPSDERGNWRGHFIIF